MLDHRLIALQGLLVPLSPIAIAVQGLIAEIQEEARRREEYRGGGRRRVDGEHKLRRHRGRDELSEAEVRAQWELLELRRRLQAEDAAAAERVATPPEPARARSQARPLASAAPALAPAPTEVATAGSTTAPDDDNLALLLLLSEA